MEQALHRAQDVHQSAAPVGACEQIAQDGYRGFALSR